MFSDEKRAEAEKELIERKNELVDTENKLKQYDSIVILPYNQMGNMSYKLI